ncbi:MAG: hypothetical protein P8P73_07235 [Flavobacteriaceae bacterium]|nr:hypothetical protein [Flavobacteriaceae bacterium]MDG2350476.1 hypothetical protein [Flavobacteriaceae bacterium]
MIKHLFHKISSVGLAMIVLFSTMSFTIEKHFCGDRLVDVALFSKLNKCNMNSSSVELDNLVEKACCKDEVNTVIGQNELLIHSFDDVNADVQIELFNVTQPNYVNTELKFSSKIGFDNYLPPNLIINRLIINQSFLI